MEILGDQKTRFVIASGAREPDAVLALLLERSNLLR